MWQSSVTELTCPATASRRRRQLEYGRVARAGFPLPKRRCQALPQIDPALIGAVWVGSESHPYAVKPTSTILAEAIGATPHTEAADWQFACKAGTETMQAGIGFVASGMARYVLGIGADTAQGRPGD